MTKTKVILIVAVLAVAGGVYWFYPRDDKTANLERAAQRAAERQRRADAQLRHLYDTAPIGQSEEPTKPVVKETVR